MALAANLTLTSLLLHTPTAPATSASQNDRIGESLIKSVAHPILFHLDSIGFRFRRRLASSMLGFTLPRNLLEVGGRPKGFAAL
jgi:hypothetical protein